MLLRSSDKEALTTATNILEAGGLVAIPTETVYGLAADACSDEAVAAIFAAKGRPRFNPLICHVSGPEMAARYVEISPLAHKLMSHFWPGPLSLVLPIRVDTDLSPLVSAGLDTLAVRMPGQAETRKIIKTLDRPLAAPSANPSGKISPTTAADVLSGLGDKVELVIDGGACDAGLESTIIAVRELDAILLRPGTVTAEDIELATGVIVSKNTSAEITSPGQLLSHYAPDSAVRLNAIEKSPDEFMIGFGPMDCDYNLSADSNLTEAASRLFRSLHLANETGKAIAISPIPNTGLGIAINDRLSRAAAPRDRLS